MHDELDERPDDAETFTDGGDVLGPPVDQPDRPTTWGEIASRESERRPIVPAWLRSKSQRRQVTHWVLGHTAHKAIYHTTRTPKYGLKMLMWAPVGAVRLLWQVGRWAMAEEGNWALRQHAATRGNSDDWL